MPTAVLMGPVIILSDVSMLMSLAGCIYCLRKGGDAPAWVWMLGVLLGYAVANDVIMQVLFTFKINNLLFYLSYPAVSFLLVAAVLAQTLPADRRRPLYESSFIYGVVWEILFTRDLGTLAFTRSVFVAMSLFCAVAMVYTVVLWRRSGSISKSKIFMCAGLAVYYVGGLPLWLMMGSGELIDRWWWVNNLLSLASNLVVLRAVVLAGRESAPELWWYWRESPVVTGMHGHGGGYAQA